MGFTAGCVAGIAGMTGFEGLGEYSTRVRLRTKNCVRNACRGRLLTLLLLLQFLSHYSIMVYSLLYKSSSFCMHYDLGMEDEF
jgi:hypothetical protein